MRFLHLFLVFLFCALLRILSMPNVHLIRSGISIVHSTPEVVRLSIHLAMSSVLAVVNLAPKVCAKEGVHRVFLGIG